MSWDGFLPKGIACKRCGARLQGAGEGRPAESYAGTYTGLCYECEKAPPFDTGDVEESGAHWYSHPPSMPSWRRDRTLGLGFPGCASCGGTGRIGRFEGGKRCAACWDRHMKHPATVARMERDARKAEAYRAWSERANAELNRRAAFAGIDPSKWVVGGDPEVDRRVRSIIDDLKRECPPPTGDEMVAIPAGWAKPAARRRARGA